jgi:23S rRNA (pseudouridine1915-N3)-methyltransferase
LTGLEADYAVRLKIFRLHTETIKPAPPAKEAAIVLSRLPDNAQLILLDAAGRQCDSDAFSVFLETRMQEVRPLFFVLGGVSGPPPLVRERADACLSLSPLTFAHTVARLVFVEQIFRADCILRGHPYPK